MEYSAGITSERLYQQDIEYVLTLLEKGLERDEIREIVLNENPFLVKTESALQKRFQLAYKRSISLNDELRKFYLTGTKYDQKALILYTFLKTYRYAYENFYELIIYRYQQKNKQLVLGHLEAFMEEKEQQSERIAKWSEVSKKRVNNTLLLFYRCSGIMDLNDGVYSITPLHVSSQLKEYAIKNDSLLTAIITLQVGGNIDDL
ncbi:BrxA family protein [Metasolibacillus meyeri]|uniref:BrxA family protein n=1 Tax=Metasolibacillus meyeri TaxID=1071052 RepID=UPI000D31912D|nr:BrxA family protein [Metasolibacillus meyeri]